MKIPVQPKRNPRKISHLQDVSHLEDDIQTNLGELKKERELLGSFTPWNSQTVQVMMCALPETNLAKKLAKGQISHPRMMVIDFFSCSYCHQRNLIFGVSLSLGKFPFLHFWLHSALLALSWWLSSKESTCQCRRHRRCGFDSWVGEISWRRKWQPAPGVLPGESHGQRNLVSYSLRGRERLGHDLVTKQGQ